MMALHLQTWVLIAGWSSLVQHVLATVVVPVAYCRTFGSHGGPGLVWTHRLKRHRHVLTSAFVLTCNDFTEAFIEKGFA